MLRFFWMACGFVGFALALPAPASASELRQHAQLWTPFVLQAPLAAAEDVRAILELQPRFFDDGQSRWIVRPSIQFAPGGGWALSLGWFEQAIVSPGKEAAWEHRPWQQASLEFQLEGWKWSNRSRLEERFLPGADLVSFRWRQQTRATIPLAAGSPWSLVLSDEVFIHLNQLESHGIGAGLDQNRAFLGLGTELVQGVRSEFGYVNNFVQSHSPGVPSGLNHVAQVSVTWTL